MAKGCGGESVPSAVEISAVWEEMLGEVDVRVSIFCERRVTGVHEFENFEGVVENGRANK